MQTVKLPEGDHYLTGRLDPFSIHPLVSSLYSFSDKGLEERVREDENKMIPIPIYRFPQDMEDGYLWNMSYRYVTASLDPEALRRLHVACKLEMLMPVVIIERAYKLWEFLNSLGVRVVPSREIFEHLKRIEDVKGEDPKVIVTVNVNPRYL